MEKLSQRIVNFIAANTVLEETQKEIIAFGIQSVLEIGLNVIVSMLILWKLHMLKEGIFFFLIFIPLRKYSGGYHADTYLSCFLFSIATLVLVVVGSQFIKLPEIILLIFVAVLSCVMWRIGPACVEGRPVSEREYHVFRNKLKKTTGIIIILAIVLVLLEQKLLLNVMFLCMSLVCITLIMGKIKYHLK